MKYFLLQNNHSKRLQQIDLINPICYDKLHKKLYDTKKSIDKYSSKWNMYRGIENPYEYVYTSSDTLLNICTICPISRSYFKLQEIIIDLNILLDTKINITCIAEGPGGFIQNINDNSNHKHNIYGITLVSKQKNVPFWSPLIENYKNVILLKGVDKTGDITNIQNINNFVSIIGKNTCMLVTSDGGIDYSSDYNSQESDSYKFIISEIIIALQIQKIGGTFVIKMFDLLYHTTIQLVYLLYMSYDSVYIHKPNMSRSSNSEKYIVCKGFKNNTNIIKLLLDNYNHTLYLDIPETFIDNIRIYNEYYITNQINTIQKIIKNINNNVKKYPSMFQLEKSKKWCIDYKLPFK